MTETAPGRYRRVARLARGGMAEVHLALALGPGGFEKPVVLKQLLPELSGQDAYRDMFAQEARWLAALHHPHVLQVLDFLEDAEGGRVLVLEYVDGVDLGRALAAGGPLEPPLARHLGLCLLAALEQVHGLRDAQGEALGLVHRDVTPGNVLLGRAGQVKLGDFGIAKGLRSPARTAPGSTRGTLAYMPPEQLRGGPLDARADLFSLGALLYEALVGEGPFAARTEAQLLLAVRDGRVREGEALEAAAGGPLAAVVRRALKPHPAERWASAAEMALALARSAEGHRAQELLWDAPRAVGRRVEATLAHEAQAPGVGTGRPESHPARARGPFSAALLEVQGSEES